VGYECAPRFDEVGIEDAQAETVDVIDVVDSERAVEQQFATSA
jgi:hypothetical protein